VRAYFMKSNRLGFSHWCGGDAGLALGLWGDPAVSRYTGGPFTDEQVMARLTREIDTLDRHQIQYWPVFLRESGEHIGCCGLRPPREAEMDVYEMGFQLRRCHWGVGLAREAAVVVIAHSFEVLGARALIAGHHPENAASRHLLRTLGFRYTHDEFYAPTQLMEPCYRLER
jgi:ribosomal-protein-alanine N-acetyltransferase